MLNLDVLQTNVVSQLHIFQLIYPRICRRPKNPTTQKTGGVIFISSANALVASPLTQWYSGTKSFLAQFARCLAPEAARLPAHPLYFYILILYFYLLYQSRLYLAFGVDVVTVLPGIIDSEFQKRLPRLECCDGLIPLTFSSLFITYPLYLLIFYIYLYLLFLLSTIPPSL